MRLAFRLLPWALLLCLSGLLALAVAAWLAIEVRPSVEQTALLSPADIERARQVLKFNDPRRSRPGAMRAMMLSQRDLELLLSQATQRHGLAQARGRVRLQPGLAVVQASLPLPASPWGGWLNLQAVLRDTPGLPEVQRLRIGRLPVPGWLAEAALPHLLDALKLRAQGELAQRMVNRVAFGPQQLVLAYTWPDNPQQALTDSVLSADDQARLRVYAERLALLGPELAPLGNVPAVVSVSRLLPPLFRLAQQRSPDEATAVLENRAALVALAFLAYGEGRSPLLANHPVARRMRPLNLTLQGRPDLPQHLLVSAALAAEGGGPLADAIGLYKEVADSRAGSGFSFSDLAADRAGTRLGLRALRDAQALQARLAAGVQESDLLPDVSDLPPTMAEGEFRRRFGGVDGEGTRQLRREIEARLDKLPLLAGGR